MWNDFDTGGYEGMLAETVGMRGGDGEPVHAYLARPLGGGPFPGVVIAPHIPGWDELNREVARRFSAHGFIALCPDIYDRLGHGRPDEIAKKSRDAGGLSDASVMGDLEGALRHIKAMPSSNGRVGVVGMCSGGRHAFLAACSVDGFDAAVDLWGGQVVMKDADLSEKRPVAPISLTGMLSCPLLGIFGNDDSFPTPEEVDMHEAELRRHGKDYEFHRYDGAGHAFWSYSGDAYRPRQAMDSWNKTLSFFDRHLRG